MPMSQQSPHETVAWNFIFPVNTNMEAFEPFKYQLQVASNEHLEVRMELQKVRGKLEMCQERLGVLQRGSPEDFEGEKAGLEAEKAKLEEKEKWEQWRLDRLLEVIKECVFALREEAASKRC